MNNIFENLKHRYLHFKSNVSSEIDKRLSPKNAERTKKSILVFAAGIIPVILIVTLFLNQTGERSVLQAVTPPTATVTSAPTPTGSVNPTISPRPGSNIYGVVFLDNNKSKKQDKSEVGISNVTIMLFLKGKSKASFVTVSDKTGYYDFKGVAKGNYTVKLTVPTAYRLTTSSSFSIKYVSGTINVNFGLVKVAAVYGKVYIDKNLNSIFDIGELSVKNTALTLKKEKQVLRRTTDANGNYSFTGITSGKYTLSVTPPKGYSAKTSSYVINFGKTDLKLNIALTKNLGF